MSDCLTPRTGRHLAPLLLLTAVLVAATVCACGGGSGGGTTAAAPTSTPSAVGSSAGAPDGGASPVATPTTTAEVTAAYFDALDHVDDIDGFRRLVSLYAEDAHYEDRAIGVVAIGRNAIADHLDKIFLAGPLEDTPFSVLVGSAWAVVEETATYGGQIYGAHVLRARDGKIVTEYIYYNDMGPGGLEYRPAPLKTPPAPTDTQTASRALATHYASALRLLDPARLAPLYARDVVYQDTVRDRLYVGPSAATAAHAKINALKGLRFHEFRGAAGPGWAAVMWKRTDREGGKPLVAIPSQYTRWARRPTVHGVTVLEIRDGKIARETIYCDHLRTQY